MSKYEFCGRIDAVDYKSGMVAVVLAVEEGPGYAVTPARRGGA